MSLESLEEQVHDLQKKVSINAQLFLKQQKIISSLSAQMDDVASKHESLKQRTLKSFQDIIKEVEILGEKTTLHVPSLEKKCLTTLNRDLEEMFNGYAMHQERTLRERMSQVFQLHENVPQLVESFKALKISFDNQVKAVDSKHTEALGRIAKLQDELRVSSAAVEAKNRQDEKRFNDRMESWQGEWSFLVADLKHKQDS